jgi:hypothetical protein
MCVNGAAAKAAQHARLDVRKTVCEVCPHKANCAYLRQAEDFADLWLVPTSMVWLPRPANMKNVSLAVIDEGFGLGGLVDLEGPPLRVTSEELEAPAVHGSGKPAATADLRADLVPLRRKLLDALEAHPASSMERVKSAGGWPDRARSSEGRQSGGQTVGGGRYKGRHVAA